MESRLAARASNHAKTSGFVQEGYRPDIDALRAVAVTLVVIFHAFPEALPGGFVGVDVFFVISGYLITGLIVPRLDAGRFRFIDFYARRARRILPALAVVLVTVVVAGLSVLQFDKLEKLGIHALAGALFFPNLLLWSEAGYFDVASVRKPLLHLWSLGVEEQFYMVWPLLLVVLGRLRWRRLPVLGVVVAASFAYSVYASLHQPVAGFYSPISRLWELGIGGMLAAWRPSIPFRNAVSIAGLALILGSAILLGHSDPFPGVRALAPVAGSALVIAAGAPWLGLRPIVGLGLISYPLYLWHWPLLSFAVIADVATPATRVLLVVASVILAGLTYLWIERPIRFGRLRQRGATIAMTATAFAACLGILVWVSENGLWRYPQEIRPVLQVLKFDYREGSRFGRCWLLEEPPPFGPECGGTDIVVWGDSHAARLYTGIENAGVSVGQFTRSSCPPVLMPAGGACAAGNAWILDEIRIAKPKRVILFAAWLNYTAEGRLDERWVFAGDLRRTLRELRAAGVPDIVLVGPFPAFPGHLPAVMYAEWLKRGQIVDRLEPAARQFDQTDAFLGAMAREEGARFVSLYAALCDASGCLTHAPSAPNDLLAWDNSHLTTVGARYVAERLALGHLPPPGAGDASSAPSSLRIPR